MATFPTYADVLIEGYSINKESALLRTEMESGPPKQAKLKSKVMITHNVQIYLSTNANFQSFESWYTNDISQGSAWFDFVNPITGSTVAARFKNGGYTATPMSAKLEEWKVSAQIEMWGD